MIIKSIDGKKYERVSRWIKIHEKIITSRHSLYDYSEHIDGENYLTYFRYKNKNFALSQFMHLSVPIFYEDTDGKLQYLSGYDSTEFYYPLICEIDDCGEYIRLYESVHERL